MSETRLRAFAERAEVMVDVPDLAGLQRRGRDLRTRRRTGVVAAAALVALVGTVVVQDRFQRADEPDKVDIPARSAIAYPGNQMHELEAGTYELFPSAVRGEPTALITVPSGWNSWEGPNRFDGHRADDPTSGRYNETPLKRSTWYVGVVVVKVLAVGRDLCTVDNPKPRVVKGVEETVEAITQAPGYRIVGPPEQVVAFGHPATHLSMRATSALVACLPDEEAPMYITSTNGGIGGDSASDVWVLDVEGVPLTVVASRSGNVPQQYLAELDAVVDSIELVPGD